MKDYSQLQQDKEYENAMVRIASDGVMKKYTKFIVDPASFPLSQNIEIAEDIDKIDPATVNEVTLYFQAALINAIKENYEVVEKPGPDVAKIRTAKTGANVARKNMTPLNFIPVALVLTAAGEASGLRNMLTVINMEGEVSDSLTGRRVAAVVQRGAHEVSVQKPEDLKGKDAYPTLDFWAEKVKKRLDGIHGK